MREKGERKERERRERKERKEREMIRERHGYGSLVRPLGSRFGSLVRSLGSRSDSLVRQLGSRAGSLVHALVRSAVDVVGVGWPIAHVPSLRIEHLKQTNKQRERRESERWQESSMGLIYIFFGEV